MVNISNSFCVSKRPKKGRCPTGDPVVAEVQTLQVLEACEGAGLDLSDTVVAQRHGQHPRQEGECCHPLDVVVARIHCLIQKELGLYCQSVFTCTTLSQARTDSTTKLLSFSF